MKCKCKVGSNFGYESNQQTRKYLEKISLRKKYKRKESTNYKNNDDQLSLLGYNNKRFGFNSYICIRKNEKNRKRFCWFQNYKMIYFGFHNKKKKCVNIFSTSVNNCNNNISNALANQIGNLIYDNDNSDFSLRIINSNSNNPYGKEAMTIMFRKYKDDFFFKRPRRSEINIFERTDLNLPRFLQSADPIFKGMNSWKIDMDSNQNLKSSKNCKIEDENHEIYAYIWKHSKNILYVEGLESICSLYLFSLSIANFICKK